MAKATRQALRLDKIPALVELDRAGIEYQQAGPNEVLVQCPVHDDSNPSVSLNTDKRVWTCRAAGCEARGDIVSLIALCLGVARGAVIEDLDLRYGIREVKSINLDMVEKFHQAIWDNPTSRQELYNRGITDPMIREARLGFHKGRITIPVFDEGGHVINIRKYLPGAPGPEKMRNTKGYTALTLYRPSDLRYTHVWVCGGEMKALAVGTMMKPHEVGAVAVTGAEGAWDGKLNRLFEDKVVYICFDVDPGGVAATRKIATILSSIAREVRIILLPLDTVKYPKGDVNDYIASEGAQVDDLLALMDGSEVFEPEEFELDAEPTEIVETKLIDAVKPEFMGKRISLEGVVHAMDTQPYLVPKDVRCICTRDQSGCDHCPVYAQKPDENGAVELTIKGSAIGVLSLVGSPRRFQRELVRDALRIPTCKAVEFAIRSHWDVFDVRVAPQLHITTENTDHVVQPSFVVGKRVDLNSPYAFTGRVYPSPKTQQAVLLFDEMRVAENTLSTYKPSEEDLQALTVFRPDKCTVSSIASKLKQIYGDLSANVTRIYEREDLHLAVDLAYHSVLWFEFDGQTHKGWVDCAIVGDSSQGKSETSGRLMEHYGLGEKVECKNASAAGLIGGVQQLGNRWFVSWGMIPTHDMRLLILEEIKGTSIEVLGKLTDLRSSGWAEISKIERRRCHARTRLIMISNPRSNRPVDSYNFGIEVLAELMGSPEDVRRFDFALLVTSSQIDPESINKLSASRPVHDHVFKSDLCRQLVLWAWTRTQDQVKFDEEATEACLTKASDLCSKFTEICPLIDRGTTRHKLARLSAALAARLFSTTNDLSTLRVRKAHVEFVYKWLLDMYSDPVFGYLDFSKAMEYTDKIMDPGEVKRRIRATRFPRDLVEHLLHSDEVTVQDLADWCDMEREEARKLMSFMVRKHALFREQRFYRKTSGFIALLKELQGTELQQEQETPDGDNTASQF